MKTVLASILLFSNTYGQDTLTVIDTNTGTTTDEPETTGPKFEIQTCTSNNCVISPMTAYDKTTYVVLTNEYDECTINCENNNCAKRLDKLSIYSGCNNTIINCVDKNDCNNIYASIGEVTNLPADISDLYTLNDFIGTKKSSVINCKGMGCKSMNIEYYGRFISTNNIFTSGSKSLESSNINCKDIHSGKCLITCNMDQSSSDPTCLKNTLQCNTRNTDDCNCNGNGCGSEKINVLRPPEREDADCKTGAVTIKPNQIGQKVICTKGCQECNIDCSDNNCGKNIEIYSGAKNTNINCKGNIKNCEKLKVRVGELELENDLPIGYDRTSFNGRKNIFFMNCDSKVACVDSNIKVIGDFRGTIDIKARELDAFQNGKLSCIDNNCKLTCAFDGCDGSMFDCRDKNDNDINTCSCDDMDLPPEEPDMDNNTTIPVTTDLYQPDGPTCPVINSGLPSEPGVVHSISNNKNSNNNNNQIKNENKGPNKVAGIWSMVVLAIIVGLLYFIVYKTKVCRKMKKYETDLIKDDGYDTFRSNNNELEIA